MGLLSYYRFAQFVLAKNPALEESHPQNLDRSYQNKNNDTNFVHWFYKCKYIISVEDYNERRNKKTIG